MQTATPLPSRPSAGPRRQRGISMVEVLITSVVLAIGMLGIAALQLTSKRSGFEAVQRTTASMLAYDMVERMRANPGGLAVYADTTNPTLDGYKTQTTPTTSCVRTPTTTPTCTPAQLADYDKWEWVQMLMGAAETSAGGTGTGGLVSPTACILTTTGTPGTSGRYMVAIAWRGPTELSNPAYPDPPAPSPDPYACGETDDSGTETTVYDAVDPDGTTRKFTHRRVLVIDTFVKVN